MGSLQQALKSANGGDHGGGGAAGGGGGDTGYLSDDHLTHCSSGARKKGLPRSRI